MVGFAHRANYRLTATFLFSPPGATDAAFRFGVSQGEKLRARDDLRRNMANLCTSVMTPITLPNWGHMAQMAKRVHNSGIDWEFLKGDRESAYKQLPLGPRYANMAVVSLRIPSSGKWMAVIPRVLLFGAVSAVVRYKCFSRALAVLLNKYLGVPLVNYYDDFGAFSPATLATKALAIFSETSSIL